MGTREPEGMITSWGGEQRPRRGTSFLGGQGPWKDIQVGKRGN